MTSPSSSPPSTESAEQSAPSQAALIRRMLAQGWRYRGGCVAVLVQQALLVTLGLAGLSLAGLGIDYIRHRLDPTSQPPHWPLGLVPPDDWQPLAVTTAIAGAILGVALFQMALRYFAAVTVADLTQRIVVQFRSDVYDKLQRLSFRFFDRHESSSIINRVTADVQSVRLFIDGVIIQVLVVGLSLAVYLVYMLSIHVTLTLACLATTPLLWFGSVRFARQVRPAYERNRELADKMVLALSENVKGAEVVRGFAREQEQIARFEAATRAIQSGKRQIFWRLSLFQPAIGFLTQFNLLVLLGYGGYLVMAGELPLGEGLFVFANLLQQFATQVGQVANVGNSIQSSVTGARRVFEVLDQPLEVESKPDAVRLPRAQGAIRFEAVGFEYNSGHSVLSKIDLEIRPGECVAIFGATGAGKSTLLSLVPRFYDPTAGRVLMDGHDIRDVRLDDLRRNIGLVFQESFLFSNTVAANIAFGYPEATRDQIERAARLAAAHDFIMELPQGYDSIVGEHGCNLSGGQRQRLAIARALLLDPAILIFDDATTAIDPETEHEILESMGRAMQGRTTLVIAHRLSTLRRADRIVVLEGGRMVQQGTHIELMAQPGHYREAARLQAEQVNEPGRILPIPLVMPQVSAAPLAREVA